MIPESAVAEFLADPRASPRGEHVKDAEKIVKESLRPGIQHELRFRVPSSKTVPALYPEAPEFQVMP